MRKLKEIKEYDGRNKKLTLGKKKFCVKTKGEHRFELVIPKSFKRYDEYKDMSIEDFYKWYNGKRNRFSFKLLNHSYFYTQCSECGKEGFIIKKQTNEPN